MTASDSWYRRATVQIDETLFDYENCDIEFKISKSSDSSQNTAEATLWNLGERTIKAISVDQPVRIRAGYGNDTGTIFEGYVTRSEPEPSGADTATIVTCSDATLLLYESENFILTVDTGQELSTAVAEVFETCTIPAGKIETTAYLFPHPRTFVGTGREILDELLQLVDSYDTYTEGGMGYFVSAENKTAEVSLINASTGLLSAEKIEDSSSDISAKIKTLLNWKIRIDAWVKVASPAINGYYKVSKYTQTLKNEVFETEMELKAV